MNLIGLAGKARTGKTTVARRLSAHGYKPMALAEPLKRCAEGMLGLAEGVLEIDEVKPLTIPALGITHRRLLQLLGTECCRAIDENLWIKLLDSRIRAFGGPVVVSDVRFENEAAWIRQNGGQIWHVIKPDAPKVEAHVSEAGIKPGWEDFYLENDGSLDDLYAKIDRRLTGQP